MVLTALTVFLLKAKTLGMQSLILASSGTTIKSWKTSAFAVIY